MALELYQFQFYCVARAAMVLLGIASIVFIVDRVVRGIRALCQDVIKDVTKEAVSEAVCEAAYCEPAEEGDKKNRPF